MSGRRLGRGVTRSAYRIGHWAVKVPNRGWVLRGWMANQSEWHQRRRPDAAGAILTLGHFALVMPLADGTLLDWTDKHGPHSSLVHIDEDGVVGYEGDEAKLCSWGLFVDGWRLIDFDRAWQQPRRGLICRAYYWNQERLARKWMRLPLAASDGRETP